MSHLCITNKKFDQDLQSMNKFADLTVILLLLLFTVLHADEAGNSVGMGTHVGIDTRHTLVMNDNDRRVVATIGVEDLVIVAMDDAFLVCSMEHEQDVREVVNWLKQHELYHWL